MLFESKASLGRFKIRSERKIYEQGIHIDTIPGIFAEFGDVVGSIGYTDPDGHERETPFIRGHFYDTVEAQGRFGYTDEERELIEKKLLHYCKTQKELIWLKEIPKPKAPWKTYDQLNNHLEIAMLAEKLDCVQDALTYERAFKNREGIIKALEAKLPVADDEELTAA